MLYTITNEIDGRTDEVCSYLTGPRLWIPQIDYPDFDAWVQRVHAQLRVETKRAMVAIERGNVIGAVVYQHHKDLSGTLEIKNITVRPENRGRHLASFLLRNAEIEGSFEFKTNKVVVDAKSSNVGIRSFLLFQRYSIKDRTNLYDLGSGEDLIYEKVII